MACEMKLISSVILIAAIFQGNFPISDGAGPNAGGDALQGRMDYPGTLENRMATAEEVDVVIVGGGASGLAAMNMLLAENIQNRSGYNSVDNIVLLEAQDKLGGRIYTTRFGSVPVEDGAEFVKGGGTNPLFKIAQLLGEVEAIIPDDQYDFRVVREDGTENPADEDGYYVCEQIIADSFVSGAMDPYYGVGYGFYFIDKFKTAYGSGYNTPLGKGWMNYLEGFVNGHEGAQNWTDISAKGGDQFEEYETQYNGKYGSDYEYTWKTGYDSLINYLKPKKEHNQIKIKLSTPVTRIEWDIPGKEGALVETGTNTNYMARHVLFTPSIGYLKKHHQGIFHPPLPNSLTSAITHMELGNCNKVMVGWDNSWWGSKAIDINIVWTNFDLPPEERWLYGVVSLFSTRENEPVIKFFVSGIYSNMMEARSESEVKADTMKLLRRVIREDIPEPIFFRRTQWKNNPWVVGSYGSYITVEGEKSGLYTRDIFRTPLKNSNGRETVLWAGEHTHNSRFSTVDGALLSGWAAAERILKM